MIRLLTIVLIFFALVWVAKRLLRFFVGRWLMKTLAKQTQSFQSAQSSVNNLSEKLVQCAHCNMFIPQAKAIRDEQRFYCSQEHAKL